MLDSSGGGRIGLHRDKCVHIILGDITKLEGRVIGRRSVGGRELIVERHHNVIQRLVKLRHHRIFGVTTLRVIVHVCGTCRAGADNIKRHTGIRIVAEAFLTLPEIFWIATKSAGSFFGKVGSFEPGYEFDALVIDDKVLNFDNYSLLHRLERFIYLGDDRQIVRRFCRGQEVGEPTII